MSRSLTARFCAHWCHHLLIASYGRHLPEHARQRSRGIASVTDNLHASAAGICQQVRCEYSAICARYRRSPEPFGRITLDPWVIPALFSIRQIRGGDHPYITRSALPEWSPDTGASPRMSSARAQVSWSSDAVVIWSSDAVAKPLAAPALGKTRSDGCGTLGTGQDHDQLPESAKGAHRRRQCETAGQTPCAPRARFERATYCLGAIRRLTL